VQEDGLEVRLDDLDRADRDTVDREALEKLREQMEQLQSVTRSMFASTAKRTRLQ